MTRGTGKNGPVLVDIEKCIPPFQVRPGGINTIVCNHLIELIGEANFDKPAPTSMPSPMTRMFNFT